jgi:hypothetical protein
MDADSFTTPFRGLLVHLFRASFLGYTLSHMSDQYKGTIVEESLTDSSILKDLKVLDVKISDDENPADRWHMYTVTVGRDDIERLSQAIKPGWYMHFWQGKHIIAVFQGRTFEFDHDDKTTWVPIIEYGISQGIPKEQLDFVID